MFQGWTFQGWTFQGWTFQGWTFQGWTFQGWTFQRWVTLGRPSHPRRKRPVSMNLERRQRTSFEFLLFSNHLINSRSKLLILLKGALDFSRRISSKINATSGYIQRAALFKPRLRRVTAWDNPFDFFKARHFDALNLLPNV
jgi:hypothetical protein